MKRRIHWNWSLGLALAVLPFAGGEPRESFSQPTNPIPVAETAAAPAEAAAPITAVVPPIPAEMAAGTDIVDAPATLISTAKPLPPAIRPTPALAELLKLADSGVEESVMLAFIANSPNTFNLGAEEIIYLNDLGVPSKVVTAMMRHDKALQTSSVGAGVAPAAPLSVAAEPPPPAPESPPALAPADMAPQPDNTAGAYTPPANDGYTTFYDPLAPYGMWVDVAGYGPCWQPTVVIVNPGWQPYCNGGRWIYTDCGWYWLSSYSWGWAPFHYGRWFCHNQYGWCWRPDKTWGPSWVSWRYTGSYCGWAPLPPAAGYTAGVGLTFHGQPVHSSFAFGLRASSYTFVPANQFTGRHLDQHALPREQATQVFSQTVPSTTIVGRGTRVVNEGIPASHMAAASRTPIHTIGIHDMNAGGARGVRGEQLAANGQTLSAFRPQFPQLSGTQPTTGGRPQSALRPAGASTPATPASTAPRATPIPSPRAVGGSPATAPASGGGSGRRSDRSANDARASFIGPIGSTPTLAHSTSDLAPSLAQPLILRGPDRSREPVRGSGASALGRTAPPNSIIISGDSRGSRWQPPSRSSPQTAETLASRPSVLRRDTSSRPAGTERTHPFMIADAAGQASGQRHAPREVEPPVRSERPSQSAASAPASHSGSSSGRAWR